MICWVEPLTVPATADKAEVMSISEAEAVRRQREAGLRKNYVYSNDQMALEDFMVVHWAWRATEAK